MESKDRMERRGLGEIKVKRTEQKRHGNRK